MLRQICALHIVKQVSELPACGPNKCYSNPLLFHSTAVTDLTLKASFHIERIACASVMAKAAAYQKDDSLRISYLMPRWCFCTIICTSIQLWDPEAQKGSCATRHISSLTILVIFRGKGQKSFVTNAIGFPSCPITRQAVCIQSCHFTSSDSNSPLTNCKSHGYKTQHCIRGGRRNVRDGEIVGLNGRKCESFALNRKIPENKHYSV